MEAVLCPAIYHRKKIYSCIVEHTLGIVCRRTKCSSLFVVGCPCGRDLFVDVRRRTSTNKTDEHFVRRRTKNVRLHTMSRVATLIQPSFQKLKRELFFATTFCALLSARYGRMRNKLCTKKTILYYKKKSSNFPFFFGGGHRTLQLKRLGNSLFQKKRRSFRFFLFFFFKRDVCTRETPLIFQFFLFLFDCAFQHFFFSFL